MHIFNLSITKTDQGVRVRAEEGHLQTLRKYETRPVSFKTAEHICREIVSILGRANLRGEIDESALARLKKAGQELFEGLLPAGAKEAVRSTSCEMLSLNIDDQLIHLPLELMHDGNNFLCLRFSTGRAVTTQHTPLARPPKTQENSSGMLVIGDPDSSLKAAYKEGMEICHGLENQQRLKPDLASSNVDKRFLKRNIRDYEILHYAGHAEYHTSDKNKCGWRMSDGIMNPDDIAEISGHGHFPFLVFANACNSARADLEGLQNNTEKAVYDMASAFLRAGSSHYIGTMCSIADASSREFALSFYKALCSGKPIGPALKDARGKLISQYGINNVTWAGYVLYGDPAFSIQPKSTEKENKPPVPEHPATSLRYRLISLFIASAIALIYMSVRDKPETLPLLTELRQDAIISQPAPLRLSSIRGAVIKDGQDGSEPIMQDSRLYNYESLEFMLEGAGKGNIYAVALNDRGTSRLLFSGENNITKNREGLHSFSISGAALDLDGEEPAVAIYIMHSKSSIDDQSQSLWTVEHISDPIPELPYEDGDYTILGLLVIDHGRVTSIIP